MQEVHTSSFTTSTQYQKFITQHWCQIPSSKTMKHKNKLRSKVVRSKVHHTATRSGNANRAGETIRLNVKHGAQKGGGGGTKTGRSKMGRTALWWTGKAASMTDEKWTHILVRNTQRTHLEEAGVSGWIILQHKYDGSQAGLNWLRVQTAGELLPTW
jgi:hypothetical protein